MTTETLKALYTDAYSRMQFARTTDELTEAIAAINKLKLAIEAEREVNTDLCEWEGCWEEGTFELPDGSYVCEHHYVR